MNKFVGITTENKLAEKVISASMTKEEQMDEMTAEEVRSMIEGGTPDEPIGPQTIELASLSGFRFNQTYIYPSMVDGSTDFEKRSNPAWFEVTQDTIICVAGDKEYSINASDFINGVDVMIEGALAVSGKTDNRVNLLTNIFSSGDSKTLHIEYTDNVGNVYVYDYIIYIIRMDVSTFSVTGSLRFATASWSAPGNDVRGLSYICYIVDSTNNECNPGVVMDASQQTDTEMMINFNGYDYNDKLYLLVMPSIDENSSDSNIVGNTYIPYIINAFCLTDNLSAGGDEDM